MGHVGERASAFGAAVVVGDFVPLGQDRRCRTRSTPIGAVGLALRLFKNVSEGNAGGERGRSGWLTRQGRGLGPLELRLFLSQRGAFSRSELWRIGILGGPARFAGARVRIRADRE